MLSMQAQTITGNWITHVIDEESEETVTYILVFGGNRMKQAMVAETPLEGVGNVSLYFTVPAQEYTLKDRVSSTSTSTPLRQKCFYIA